MKLRLMRTVDANNVEPFWNSTFILDANARRKLDMPAFGL